MTRRHYFSLEPLCFHGEKKSIGHALAPSTHAFNDQTTVPASCSGATWSGATCLGATCLGATCLGATCSGLHVQELTVLGYLLGGILFGATCSWAICSGLPVRGHMFGATCSGLPVGGLPVWGYLFGATVQNYCKMLWYIFRIHFGRIWITIHRIWNSYPLTRGWHNSHPSGVVSITVKLVFHYTEKFCSVQEEQLRAQRKKEKKNIFFYSNEKHLILQCLHA